MSQKKALIVVEGKADKRFLEEYIAHLGYSDFFEEIHSAGGWENWSTSAPALKEAEDNGLLTALIFDADANVSTRRSQLKRKLDEFGSTARIFLIPNDANSGCLEDLLVHLVPEPYQPVIDYWDNFIDALRGLKPPLVPSHNLSSSKAKFYSYDSLFREKGKKEKVAAEEFRRYKGVEHWDLDAPYLDPLKKFIEELLFGKKSSYSVMNKRKPYILLSFDIEEFDVPREHGVELPMEEQARISIAGTEAILDILKEHQVKATFFSTANFAQLAPAVITRLLNEGHELASHGYYHWTFETADLKRSKDALETQTGVTIRGYRQARMMPVAEQEVQRAGYTYNSSLNPTFIPGRYMHLSAPRTYFMKEGILQIPASVTPILRFPLFWLSCHNLPFGLYRWLCRRTLRHDGYLVVYFHPWEFYPLGDHPELKLPFIVRNNSGEGMKERLSKWISAFKEEGTTFVTFTEFTDSLNSLS